MTRKNSKLFAMEHHTRLVYDTTSASKALFIWSELAHLSGLPHLGGMFLSFRSYDIFIPLRWAGFLLKMTFRLMWFLISVLSHSRLRSNPKSISLEWDIPPR